MGPGGALEAVIETRQQGLARFIGVIGHGWAIARGPWAAPDRTHTMWDQPLEEQAAIDRVERRPADDGMAAMLDSKRMTSLSSLSSSLKVRGRQPIPDRTG